jgi:transcriptional regulator with XRE-family HTH domain
VVEGSAQQVRNVYKARLSEVRKHRGWTQKQLALEVTEKGHPIDRATINRIERGKRTMEVAELVAFAAALDVEPAALFLPQDVEWVHLTDNIKVTAEVAAKWAAGRGPLDPKNARLYFSESPTFFGEAHLSSKAEIRASGVVTRGSREEES